MTVASEIQRIQTNIANAYTAASAKGATLPATENSDNLATCIGTITGSSPVITSLSVTPTTSAQTITAPSGTDGYSPVSVAAVTSSIDANITAGNIKDGVTILGVTGSYTGGGGEYPLTRISDDNANEIGTAFMEFTDANSNKFKVVLLDEQYWTNGVLWTSSTGGVTDMPQYSFNSNTFWGNAKETATQNTQLILDWCLANNYTSAACEHCRSQSFVINGTTYYGQLPNMPEVFEILKRFSDSIGIKKLQLWSSTQNNNSNVWTSTNSLGWTGIYGDGAVYPRGKTQTSFEFHSAPVLEIPLS